MTHLMRTAFAILFCALLVFGNSSIPAAGALGKSEPKCVCACGKKCCVSESSPISASQPAAPATVAPLKQVQFALISPAPIYSLPAASSAAGSFADFSSDRSSAVPLYEWNCAYLI